jgi:predicted acyl esterase
MTSPGTGFEAIVQSLLRAEFGVAAHEVSEVRCRRERIAMRDGTLLAADLYLPPRLPAPVIVSLTPYGRGADALAGTFLSFARRGFAGLAVDCRGTGASEPDVWDYYMYESEDAYDLVDWASRQAWCGGVIGSCGGSYAGQTQWCMATHPAMRSIAPQVSGLGIGYNTAHIYMLLNAYSRSVGKGRDKVSLPIHEIERAIEAETMAGGYYDAPMHAEVPAVCRERIGGLGSYWTAAGRRKAWLHYASLPAVERAQFVREVTRSAAVTAADVESLSDLFGCEIAHDRHCLPRADTTEMCRAIHAAPLMITGWYDWGLNDALATWEHIRRDANPSVAQRARLVIGPHAHAVPGYHEGVERHPELMRSPGTATFAPTLLRWYECVHGDRVEEWPTVLYYLMGANEWRQAVDWPVPGAESRALYLGPHGKLLETAPTAALASDTYVYDPFRPTPTVGGSIVSYVYPAGSVDVSVVQRRPDVLTYTTVPFDADLDVVGPLRVILHASSSAVDTDFNVRLSDVFPDGRAIQLQSAMMRARYRNVGQGPEPLLPGAPYRFEIDLWATANRFKAGHSLRLDVSSADFPRFDRNSNLGGRPGEPTPARQTVFRSATMPSSIEFKVLPK